MTYAFGTAFYGTAPYAGFQLPAASLTVCGDHYISHNIKALGKLYVKELSAARGDLCALFPELGNLPLIGDGSHQLVKKSGDADQDAENGLEGQD